MVTLIIATAWCALLMLVAGICGAAARGDRRSGESIAAARERRAGTEREPADAHGGILVGLGERAGRGARPG